MSEIYKSAKDVTGILSENRVGPDTMFFTHVSLISPKGRFQINKNAIENFWSSYCGFMHKNFDNSEFGIAEKSTQYLPVLVDVDIKVEEEGMEDVKKIYTDKHLFGLIAIYQNVLRSILEEYKEEELCCFVLEKSLYQIENNGVVYIKNGFHLHFPYIFMSKTDQQNVLIPKVQVEVDNIALFSDINVYPSSKIIDKGYMTAPWLLYGSKKDIDMDAYMLTKIIDVEGKDIDIKTALRNYKLYDSNEREIDIAGKERFYLPRILSIIPSNRKIYEVKQNVLNVAAVKKQLASERKVVNKSYEGVEYSQAIVRVRRLLGMLNPARAEDRNEWMTVGWILYNIGDGSEECLNLWLDFSSKCPEKFDENVCVHTWEKMTRKNLGIGTLQFYAKQDNPEEYKRYVNELVDKYIKDITQGCSHNDIAKGMYMKYGTDFKCASITQNVWFQYTNHRWNKIDDGYSLRSMISSDEPDSMLWKFKQNLREFTSRMASSEDDAEKAMYKVKIAQLTKIMGNLKSATFKNNVMRECREVFYDENFLKKIDKNPFLICFKNGVYDLKQCIFRNGLPEDYLSLQMPIEYRDYKNNDAEVKEVVSFLEKIFPDRSIREYFMDVSSDIFIGGNKHKKVYFWSGEGDNGKSITQTIFEKMLGEYSVKLPTSLIVGKRTQSSAACPELVRAGNGVRWAVLQEPDKKDVINIGILKELSGNDTFFARGLYKEGSEIEPMFKLVIICNDPPMIPYSDKATWNRIRVIPFESTFCDDAPENYEDQLLEKRFPKDPFFTEKIPELVQPFAWVLLQHRKQELKRVEPEKVKIATFAYKKKNDVYRQFIEERIEECKDKKLSISDIYHVFKDWYKQSFPNQNIPVKNDVREYFTRNWGEPERGIKWTGYTIKYENENENENENNRDDL